MSQWQQTVALIKQYRFPSRAEIAARSRNWWRSDSKWFAISVAVHGVVLLAVAFIPMSDVTRPIQEAISFEPAHIDTTTGEADFANFQLNEPQIEPTEIALDTISAPDTPAMELAVDENFAESAETQRFGDPSSNGILSVDSFGTSDLLSGAISAPGSGPGGADDPGRVLGIGRAGTAPPFGSRTGAQRTRLLIETGGTKQTEQAVQGALIWFARHQNPDGSWSLNQHVCKDGNCTCSGAGEVQSNTAATAFALLPYLAAGQTHLSEGKFQQTIKRGLEWLIAHQDLQTGSLVAKGDEQIMYSHGIAAIVLAEAYGLSRDVRLGRHAQAAVNFIQSAQGRETGSWVYAPNPAAKNGDTSVFGWQLMALKSAQMAGLQVNPQSLLGAKKWLNTVSKGKSGGLFCYNAETGPTPTMTAVGLLGTQYLGASRKDPRIVEGMNYFMTLLPNPKSRNCYYWYYATQVMHNLPGPEWDRWNREMRRVLTETQAKEGCALGSWDPQLPTPDPWAKQGGRIMVTSIAALTLEVYYRYLPLYRTEPVDTVLPKTVMK